MCMKEKEIKEKSSARVIVGKEEYKKDLRPNYSFFIVPELMEIG
jgi:hypothetical protein